MGKANGPRKPKPKPAERGPGITSILVAGFKSIATKQEIDIKPLTVLAGANSSGKTSMMQPLLLLKQTLEVSYDPGPLLLNGPHVRFTSAHQLFSLLGPNAGAPCFSVGVTLDNQEQVVTSFTPDGEHPVNVSETEVSTPQWKGVVHDDLSPNDLWSLLPPVVAMHLDDTTPDWRRTLTGGIVRRRCFLEGDVRVTGFPVKWRGPSEIVDGQLRRVLHLPGLRGNPERTYRLSGVGPGFPGTFENYVASIIAHWQRDEDTRRIAGLNEDLGKLGLTWKATAQRVSDTEVSLSVGRLPRAARGGADDLVSIADVGFGVSQVLPVIVALHTAEPGQLVYIEQPELHLHPKAQVALAEVLGAAAKRGIRLVVETHSALLILALQSLVAEGKLSPDLVKLHWFKRGRGGATTIRSADLDENGAYGDWPEDFADVALAAESRYLDAVEARHAKG